MFDNFIVIWVVISVLAVILESVQAFITCSTWSFSFWMPSQSAFSRWSTVCGCIAVLKSLGYQKAVSGRIKMAKSTSSIIDLLAIAPFS
jgi:voltage-gated potassium channel